MKYFGSYSVENESISELEEIDRLATQALLSWQKEAELMTIYGLKSGVNLLEVGSGPGFVSKQILDTWADLNLTMLEADPNMIIRAKTHLEGYEGIFIENFIETNHLESNQFDFVFARLVLQHLVSPLTAIKEIYRLLKPNGKIIISDVDSNFWGTVQPYQSGLEHIYQKYAIEQAKSGGNRLNVSQISGMLKASNFKNVRTDIFSYNSDELGLTPFLPQIRPERYDSLLRKGIINEMEYAHLYASYQRLIDDPKVFVLLMGIMACGEKS